MSTALLNSEKTDLPDEGTPPFPGLDVTQEIKGDTDAPWGRRADGTPKSKPGAKPAGTPRRAAAPRPRTAAKPRPASKSAGPDYRPALVALFSLPTFITSIAARGIKDENARRAVQLDGMACKVHSQPMSEALNETAKTQPGLARILDKVVSAGPYGLILAAAVPFGMQLLANHGAIEPNEGMGILPADKLAALAQADAWADA